MTSSSNTRRGEPNVAVLLTWFLPGAGHLYIGRATTAVLVFLFVEALYAAGWFLSEGRSFEFLDPELRSSFATVLTPEVGNLGGMIAQMRSVGFGTLPPRPFADSIHLGSWLTGISGLLNVFAMIHVHLAARGLGDPAPAEKGGSGLHPALLVGSAWAIPGLGHFLQGRKLRGAVVFLLLVGFFAWGTMLAEGTNLSRERHFYYWAGQALVGIPAFITEVLSGRPPVTSELAYGDVGLLFASLAGLLNVLAMLDVYAVAERRWTGAPAPAAKAAPSGEATA